MYLKMDLKMDVNTCAYWGTAEEGEAEAVVVHHKKGAAVRG